MFLVFEGTPHSGTRKDIIHLQNMPLLVFVYYYLLPTVFVTLQLIMCMTYRLGFLAPLAVGFVHMCGVSLFLGAWLECISKSMCMLG